MINKTISILIVFIWLNALSHVFVLPSYLIGKNKEAASLVKNTCANLFSNIYQKQLGSTIHYKGKIKPTEGKVDVVISNHIATIDFALVSAILEKIGFSKLYYILKRVSAFYPLGTFVFISDNDIKISRKWSEDENHMARELKNIKNGTIIIFPEGRRFTEKLYEEGVKFSQENNFPIFKNTLVPRTKGTWKILSYLNKENRLGKLYDLTVTIPKFLKKTAYMEHLLTKEIGNSYVNLRTITLPGTNILHNKDTFKRWFMMMWKEKDYIINDIIYKNKDNYKVLDTDYKTSNYILVITSVILFIFLIKRFGWKYLAISFGLMYGISFYRCYVRK